MGVKNMTVKEATELLAYGVPFYLKGSYSGKIYYRTWVNKKKCLEKYYDEVATDKPYFPDLYTPKGKYDNPYTYPIIGIWMIDYYICHPEKAKGERYDSNT